MTATPHSKSNSTSGAAEDEAHYRHMLLALQLADKCVPTTTAFCVGCTIYTRSAWTPRLLSTGFSRELPGNTHAEQCALDKIAARCREPAAQEAGAEPEVLELDLYTTMEPCSKRASDPKGCAHRIIDFNAAAHVLPGPSDFSSASAVQLRIARVFQGVREPADFQLCEGQRLLREAGVEVHTVLPPADADDDAAAGGSGQEWLEKECLRIAKKSHADEPAAPGPDVVRLWKEAAL
ncbi:hypothetical protein OC844_005929 [Tilletia horrida]|nr:hypothetical protein OC844_005929 [Tilletia horrida]